MVAIGFGISTAHVDFRCAPRDDAEGFVGSSILLFERRELGGRGALPILWPARTRAVYSGVERP